MQKIFLPKKNGGKRLIFVPNEQEKQEYKEFLPSLTDVLIPLSKHSHAFLPGKSAVTAAIIHVNYEITICWDLKDFFDSVRSEMIQEYLDFDCSKLFIDGAPRQGLPTSPLVANLAAIKLDNSIQEFIQDKAVYTRYADDLTISTNDYEFHKVLLDKIPEIVESYKFIVNKKKTRVQFAKAGNNSRSRIICGVAVNSSIGPTRKTKRKLRALKHKASLPTRHREKFAAKANGVKEWSKKKLPLQYFLNKKTNGNGYYFWNLLKLNCYNKNLQKKIVKEFSLKYFNKANKYLEENFPNLSKRYAAALVCVFGHKWYDWIKGLSASQVHDYCYWLPTSVVPSDNLGVYLFKWRRELENFQFSKIEIISKNWHYLSLSERNMSINDIVNHISIFDYKNIKDKKFAIECAKFGCDNVSYKKHERRWIKAQKSITHISIPQIDISDGDYRIYNIDKSDPKGVWIGEYTNCCQHLDGEGSSCAWHSVESPDGSILVFEYNGKIIAQSWVWRSEDIVVADNCEAISGQDFLPSLYAIWARAIINKLCIKEVRIGERGDIDIHQWKKVNSIEPPKNCYSDAYKQRLIL